MNMSAAEFSILLPAFVAGLLVTATHVPLGTQVLVRGIVFIDLAIAQIAGCGVLLADQLGFEPQGVAVQVAALIAAIAGALLLTWTERRWPGVQEAVIGVTFVLAATGSVLLWRATSTAASTCAISSSGRSSGCSGQRSRGRRQSMPWCSSPGSVLAFGSAARAFTCYLPSLSPCRCSSSDCISSSQR
jgi:hypothetical protein